MASALTKVTRYERRRLLDSARGRPCVLCEHFGQGSGTPRPRNFDPCSNLQRSRETTVPAHLPGAFYGMPAGTGQKTHDWLVAHLCDLHHTAMDSTWRKDPQMRMLALCLTLERLFAEGVLGLVD